MTKKDSLDIVKNNLENALESSQDSAKILKELFPEASQSYLNGFHDGVILLCKEVLDLINLLSK